MFMFMFMVHVSRSDRVPVQSCKKDPGHWPFCVYHFLPFQEIMFTSASCQVMGLVPVNVSSILENR